MALQDFPRRGAGPAIEPFAAPGFPRHRIRAAPKPALNMSRGLFRIWLLISAAWMMSWAIYLTMYALDGGYAGNAKYTAIPILLLAPPAALWVFGVATRWAVRGFE